MTKSIPLKQWVTEEALRLHVKPHTIYQRRLSGWYPGLSTVSINSKVIFVERDETPRRVRLVDWINKEARRIKLTPIAIYQRIYRGKYPKLSLVKLNERVVFVEL
jgi:hypothetical protein